MTASGKKVAVEDADETGGEEETREEDTTCDKDAKDSRKRQHESTKRSHRSKQVE